MISLWKLYLIFVKIGAILLGGGYVILPIMISEVSEKRNLVTQDEIVDYFAISQSLPGIIAANISIFVGYKLKGKIGAVLAMFGVITVPFLLIVFLASVLNFLVGNQIINGIFWGVGISVVALIILTVREMWQKSVRDNYFYLIFIATLLALVLLEYSPVRAIIVFTVIGVLYKKFLEKKEAN